MRLFPLATAGPDNTADGVTGVNAATGGRLVLVAGTTVFREGGGGDRVMRDSSVDNETIAIWEKSRGP